MPAPKAHEGGQSAEMHDAPVEVWRGESRFEADLIVGLLHSSGLSASVVTDEAGGAQLPGARVLVAASDAGPAWALLAAQTAESVDDS